MAAHAPEAPDLRMTISLAAVQRSTGIFNRSATTDKVCHLIHEAGERERMLFGSLKALSCAPIPGDNAPIPLPRDFFHETAQVPVAGS